MPKSRSKRSTYQPPKKVRRRRSAPWVGPTIVVCLLGGLGYILLYYAGVLPWSSSIGNYNLIIGFVPLIVGLLLATTWA